jgi:hypothetical protein
MFKYAIGISPFYHSNASGHFGRVLPSISRAIAIEARITPTDSEYFGLKEFEVEQPMAGGISAEFQRLNAIVSPKEIKLLAKEIGLKVLNKPALLHIYEGTFSLLLASALAGKRSKNLTTLFNFHNVEFYLKLSKSKFTNVFFKLFLNYITRLDANIIFCTESKRAAELLESELNLHFEVFPMFSTVTADFDLLKKNRKKRSNVLVLIGGKIDLNTLLNDLQQITQVPKRITIFDVRLGYIENSKAANILSNLGYRVLKDPLNDEDYVELFITSETVWFLTRSEINNIGSSGRLTDALLCGCEIVVPQNSALEDMTRLYKEKYQTFSFSKHSIVVLGEVSKKLGTPLRPIEELTPRGAAKKIIDIYARNLPTLKRKRWINSIPFSTIYAVIYLGKVVSRIL